MTLQWSTDLSTLLRDECVILIKRYGLSSTEDFRDEHFCLLAIAVDKRGKNGCSSDDVRQKISEMKNNWIAWKDFSDSCRYWLAAKEGNNSFIKFQNDPLTTIMVCDYMIMFGGDSSSKAFREKANSASSSGSLKRKMVDERIKLGSDVPSIWTVMREINALVSIPPHLFAKLSRLLTPRVEREVFAKQPPELKGQYVLALYEGLEKRDNLF